MNKILDNFSSGRNLVERGERIDSNEILNLKLK
jgi:hypothetical protein